MLFTAADAPDEAPAGGTAILLLLLLLLPPFRKGTSSRSWGRSWPPFMAPRRAAIACDVASMCVRGRGLVRTFNDPADPPLYVVFLRRLGSRHWALLFGVLEFCVEGELISSVGGIGRVCERTSNRHSDACGRWHETTIDVRKRRARDTIKGRKKRQYRKQTGQTSEDSGLQEGGEEESGTTEGKETGTELRVCGCVVCGRRR